MRGRFNIPMTEYYVEGENAKELESIMKDAGLIVLPNSSHYAYLENINQVVNIIKEFV